MVTQKFTNSDSIDDAVKLLQKILTKKETKCEESGGSRKTEIIKGIEVVTYMPPEIPLELPDGYFSNLKLKQLKETREKWQLQWNQDNKKLQDAVEKLDTLSTAGKVMKNQDKIENASGVINHWNTRIQQIDFLIGELSKAISKLEPAPTDILVPGTKLSKLLNMADFPPGYFSGLDLSQLETARDEWQLEINTKREKLENKTLKLKRMNDKGKSKKGDERTLTKKIGKLENELQKMDLLMDQLKKAIEKGSKMRTKKDRGFAKDPILEEIKNKMGILPKKKEPLPKMPKKKIELKESPLTQTMFTSNQIADIKNMFGDPRNTSGTEIEASFGVFKNSGKYFDSGVYSGIYFSNLLARMTAASVENYSQMDIKYSNTLVEIKKAEFRQGGTYNKFSYVRKIVDLTNDSEEWQHKDKVRSETIDNRMWGIRVSKSIETFLENSQNKVGGKIPSTLGDVGVDPKTWKPSISRYRKRTSFTEGSKYGFFYGVRIDLTVVRKIDHDRNYDSRGFDGFEVEVEKINNKNISAGKFTDIIERIYRWMFGDYSYNVFIREVGKAPEENPLRVMSRPRSEPASRVSWDKKNKLFSDGTFAYMTEDGEKVYGKVVPNHIRVLTDTERQNLEVDGKQFKTIRSDDKMKNLRDWGVKSHSDLKGKRWDENLQIITDGIYAYEWENKVYAIIVGPEQLSKSDKEQLKQKGQNIKTANQAEVNKITKKIRKGMKGKSSPKEPKDIDSGDASVEIYQKPSGSHLVYHEEEITWHPNHIMTVEERQTAINLHNELFWYDMKKKGIAPPPATGKNEEACTNNYYTNNPHYYKGERTLQPLQLWSNYWNRPTNVKLKHFLDPRSKWALTLKYDGVRSFLFIHEYGTYMVNPPYTLIYMGKGNKDMSGTLLDGEFMSDLDKTTNSYTRITFWAFDILFAKDEDCRAKRLIERLSILNNSVQILKENPKNFPYLKTKKYIMKDSPILAESFKEKDTEFFQEKDVYEKIRNLLKENKNLLEKIKTLLREIQIPEEAFEVLLKKIEALKEISVKDIKTLLTEAQISRKDIKTLLRKIETFLKENKEIVEKTDGLILQPYNWYCNKYTYKWKPPSQLTIDFYLQKMTPQNIQDRQIEYVEGEHYYYTKVGGSIDRNKKIDMSIFTGDYDHPYKGWISQDYPNIEKGGEPIDGRIVECEWRIQYKGEKPNFVPLRIREDRTRPNDYIPTAISVWQDIKNPITQNTVEGLDLKIMRKYHNEVKMALLAKYFASGSTILDIGSGRGGDIHKWRTLGLGRVYAMEPDTGKDIAEFRKRLEEDKENKKRTDARKDIPFTYPKVEVLNYGAQETLKIHEKLKADGVILDGMVAFFSMTFFPESEKMYKSLLDTIDLLPNGSKFIGIVLEGEKVNTLLKTSESVYIKDYSDIEFIVKGYDSKTDEIGEWGIWDDSIEAWVFNKTERPEVEKWMKTHKAYNCEAFTINQQGAFFGQKDEDEEEVDKISNSIIGDKIMIDLRGTGDDQTTMVHDQTEWLFNFKYFKKKLKERMFIEVESYTLDNSIKSSNGELFAYQNLPKDSQVFSSLNKVFVFKKKGLTKEEIKGAEVLKQLDPDKTETIRLKLGGVEYDNIQRVGVIQSYASLIHAVLSAVDDEYKRSADKQVKIIGKIEKYKRVKEGSKGKRTDKEKEKELGIRLENIESKIEGRVNRIRNLLADELTLEEFQELHGGSIAKKFEEKVRNDSDQKNLKLKKNAIKEEALKVFKETLNDTPSRSKGSGSWMGELEMTELLSSRYRVNIYVVSAEGTLGDMVLVKPSTLFSNYCDQLYSVSKKSVVLLRQSGLDYDLLKPLGDDKSTNTFDADSEFVQQLYQEICG